MTTKVRKNVGQHMTSKGWSWGVPKRGNRKGAVTRTCILFLISSELLWLLAEDLRPVPPSKPPILYTMQAFGCGAASHPYAGCFGFMWLLKAKSPFCACLRRPAVVAPMAQVQGLRLKLKMQVLCRHCPDFLRASSRPPGNPTALQGLPDSTILFLDILLTLTSRFEPCGHEQRIDNQLRYVVGNAVRDFRSTVEQAVHAG